MPKAKKNLDDALVRKGEYDKESQDILTGLSIARDEIGKLESMKRTEGWKILNQKIREELHNRIEELIQVDEKVVTLIALLKLSDTKNRSRALEIEIDKFLPEE